MTRLVYELDYYEDVSNTGPAQKLLKLALHKGKYRKYVDKLSVDSEYGISKKLHDLIRKKFIELDLMTYFQSLGYNFLVEVILCDHYDMWFNRIEIVGTPSELTNYKMRYQ